MEQIILSRDDIRAMFDPYVMGNDLNAVYSTAYVPNHSNVLRNVLNDSDVQRQVVSKEDQLNLPSLPKFLAPREYTPKQIIHNPNAVIVFWENNTKTIVRRREGDTDDIHSAFSQALAKKLFGATTTVHKMVDKVTKEQTIRKKDPQ